MFPLRKGPRTVNRLSGPRCPTGIRRHRWTSRNWTGGADKLIYGKPHHNAPASRRSQPAVFSRSSGVGSTLPPMPRALALARAPRCRVPAGGWRQESADRRRQSGADSYQECSESRVDVLWSCGAFHGSRFTRQSDRTAAIAAWCDKRSSALDFPKGLLQIAQAHFIGLAGCVVVDGVAGGVGARLAVTGGAGHRRREARL